VKNESDGARAREEDEDEEDDNVEVVFPTSQSRALQELNAALQQERKASNSLWRKMKLTMASLF
jgi:hypothetical protein